MGTLVYVTFKYGDFTGLLNTFNLCDASICNTQAVVETGTNFVLTLPDVLYVGFDEIQYQNQKWRTYREVCVFDRAVPLRSHTLTLYSPCGNTTSCVVTPRRMSPEFFRAVHEQDFYGLTLSSETREDESTNKLIRLRDNEIGSARRSLLYTV